MRPSIIPFFLSAFAVLLLGGCETANPSSAMVAAPAGAITKHAASVNLSVTGGADKSTDSATQISNPDFIAALTKSIRRSGLFAKITPENGTAEYHLDVAIVSLDQPVIGAAMTATLETKWTLTRRSNDFVMWEKTIKTSHTTEAREAFTGVERLHLAMEGAAKDNIHDGIVQLGAITLP